jgi:hypothetical protein
MIKTFLSVGAAAALLSSATLATAGDFHYNAITRAVMTKTTETQTFSLGEITLPHFIDTEDTQFSGKFVYRDFFSLTGFWTHAEQYEGKVRTNAFVENFRLFSGGSNPVDILNADSVKSIAWDNELIGPMARSEFVNLRVLGQPFEPSGEPNQAYTVNIVGYGKVHLVFNSEVMQPDGRVTHSAVRIAPPNGEQIFVANVVAGSTFKIIAP